MTRQPTNPELFDLYCAKVFDYLFEHFPIQKSLNGERFTGVKVENDNIHDMPIITDNLKVFLATVQWLAEEGYIRYKSQLASGYEFSSTVLTNKALTAMKKSPNSLSTEDKRTVADLIKDAVKTGSDQAIKTSVAILFTILLQRQA